MNNQENNEKIIRRVEDVINYKILNPHASTRQIAKVFEVSNYTINIDLTKRAPIFFPEKYAELMGIIEEIMQENPNLDEVAIKKRVLNNTKLYLKDESTTVEDLVTESQGYYSIYRDLTKRLSKLNPDYADIVKTKMEHHRLGNLISKGKQNVK